MPEVIFQYGNQTKHVDKTVLACLKRYLNEYYQHDRVFLSDSCDFRVFCHFIDFLVSGIIPSDKNDQIGVYRLLREWESHFGILDSYCLRLSVQEKDGIIVYNGEEFPVNIGCLFLHSGVFREFYNENCGMVFSFELLYSKESFKEFLNLIHNRISYPRVDKSGDVYDICEYLCCDTHFQLLNDDSPERILAVLLQRQNDDRFDISKYEKCVIDNIETYLRCPSLCLVSLPSLFRIFGLCNQTFSLSSLEPFLIGCINHHGTGAQMLINCINYQKSSDLSELESFLHIMSVDDSSEIYRNFNHALSFFQREFYSMKDEKHSLIKKIEHKDKKTNRKLQELENLIQQQNEKLHRFDQEISSLKMEIQAKEKVIEEKDQQIQSKVINEQFYSTSNFASFSEYSYTSNLFSGIFNGLLTKQDLIDTGEISIEASSMHSKPYDPYSVLKNDSSRWISLNSPESWIRFDFKKRKVSITSYSMNDGKRIKSWQVEGSTDGSTFEIIDKKMDTTVFQNSSQGFNDPNAQMNFTVQPNNKYYKYIRIKNISKNWLDNYIFFLYRFELFGFVKSE